MGKQDMVLMGGWKGGFQQRPLPDPGLESQSLMRRKASPCWARSSSLATWTAHRDLPAPAWGTARGQSPEGGVDWCLDKVGEEAALKEEYLQA